MVDPYNALGFSFKKEGDSDTVYNVHEPKDVLRGEVSQSQKDNA